MRTAQFHFFGELNDLLPPNRRFTPFEDQVDDHASLKHVIESLGVPHTEIGSIQMDGQTASMAARVADHSQIDIYPYHYSGVKLPEAGDNLRVAGDNLREAGDNHRNAGAAQPIRPLAPPGEPRFILDIHLGKLAVYLRILGFDSMYQNDFRDDVLAELAERFDRILLSKDRRLLMRNQVHYGYCVRSQDPAQQTLEIVLRYQLSRKIKPLQRCLDCNTPLEPVDKQSIADRLEPLTRRFYHEFHHCPNCDKIYWKGSHYARMRAFIAWIKDHDDE